MRNLIIHQLRERSSVKGKQKTWVSELDDDQLYELFLRLRNGESAKSIARFIQKSWGILTSSSSHSLSQGVTKFRRRVGHLLIPESTVSEPPRLSPNIEQIQAVEGTEGLEQIAQIQLERIQRLMAEEKETGIRYTSLSREVHSLVALTKAIMKSKEWDLVHEGNDPSKRRRIERTRQRMGIQFEKLTDHLGDGGGDRLVKAMKKFLELAEEHAVSVTLLPDGKIRPAKS